MAIESVRKELFQKVFHTPFIDTHEHLIEEQERLNGKVLPWPGHPQCDDWTSLLLMYFASDLLTSGMPQETYDKFFSQNIDPIDKWAMIEPYWPSVKNTGYGKAITNTFKKLYGVEELSAETVKRVQSGYEKTRSPGFYKQIFELANIESCQVNCLSKPFNETSMPTLLMQDLSIVAMFTGDAPSQLIEPTGIEVASLLDWYKVIEWWFNKYSRYAVAVKSQNAYARDIDYERVPLENVESIFKKRLNNESLSPAEKKAIEDHLFWYSVNMAAKFKLPVKLHTGYYAGQNYMPLSRLKSNPGSAADLCRTAPEINFVFMHICYPYYEELISLAKHYTNAFIDMCWAWIINPIASKDFLKKYLLTAPANKILTFGGDYLIVEVVLGHATIARHGIALALSELVEEGWLTLDNALELVDAIMHNNARRIFNISKKTKILETVHWG